MTTALRITSGIFAILSGLLFHFTNQYLGLSFAIIALGSLLMSLFWHRKEENEKHDDNERHEKEKMMVEARKAYERKDIKKLLSTIDSFDVPEKIKHGIYNTVVLERKPQGGTVKSNPYKNE
jgi:flagellar biosynthesis component FlhA